MRLGMRSYDSTLKPSRSDNGRRREEEGRGFGVCVCVCVLSVSVSVSVCVRRLDNCSACQVHNPCCVCGRPGLALLKGEAQVCALGNLVFVQLARTGQPPCTGPGAVQHALVGPLKEGLLWDGGVRTVVQNLQGPGLSDVRKS